MMKKASEKGVIGPLKVNISDGFVGVPVLFPKSLSLVYNHSLSRGGGWRQFVVLLCLLGKVRQSHSVCRSRCLKPDEDRQSPVVCWRYLVGARIGFDWSQSRIGSCCSRKKQLNQYQGLLEIFGVGSTFVWEFWSGPMSVQDITLGLT